MGCTENTIHAVNTALRSSNSQGTQGQKLFRDRGNEHGLSSDFTSFYASLVNHPHEIQTLFPGAEGH